MIFRKRKRIAAPVECRVNHPEWSENAVLYEVNIRQFTPEGTFIAFSRHLPRLKDLGVNVLWFMPIHPIGRKNRKGSLGSYYSVMDFRAVNPEFGTRENFLELLRQSREMGMHVLMDWVPNHTAWDHPWTTEHPEWYVKDAGGRFIPPRGFDWTDVIQLDWTNPEMQDAMLDAMKYWVGLGVDGFRVDHPHNTPKDFWERARRELEKIRPVFLLAENEEQMNFLEEGFDMNYSWELYNLMNRVAKGKRNASHLRRYFRRERSAYPANVYRMRFLDNHDENSWHGTVRERLGDAREAMAVLLFTMPGLPLLYNGQEVCLDKRLEFFEKDPIEWKECRSTGFYKTLVRARKENPALRNGDAGAPMNEIRTSGSRYILAFSREKEGNEVITLLNLSHRTRSFTIYYKGEGGEYLDVCKNKKIMLPSDDPLALEPWGYRLLIR